MKQAIETSITPSTVDRSFTEEVKKMPGGERVLDCFACGVCSGSCPTRFAMDYSPMQVVRMIQLGVKEKALSTSTIWLCASCQACTTRCPRGIEIPLLMSALKNIAISNNIQSKIEAKPKFHKLFTSIVRDYGRMHEPSLFLRLVKKTDVKALVSSAFLGLRLTRKGKVRLKPSKADKLNQFLSAYEKVNGGNKS